MSTGDSQGLKQPVLEADHLLTTVAEVKSTCIYTSISPLRVQGVITFSQQCYENICCVTLNFVYFQGGGTGIVASSYL
jgi:hypothetical protein